MAYYIYILRCGDQSLYTGSTNDVQRRFQTHCAGKGAKYTRARRPLTLVYQEKWDNRSQALQREAQIKKLSRKDKLALIASMPDGFGCSTQSGDVETVSNLGI